MGDSPVIMAAAFRFGILPKRVETRLQEWINESNSVNVFVAGKTGTGKTTLVNGLVGREVSPEGDTLDPGSTTTVCDYLCKFEDILVKVFDTPGLQAGHGHDEEYLRSMIRRWNNIDLFVYCIQMKIRFVDENSDILSMRQLSESLGYGIWKNSLIILTFANDIVAFGKAKGIALEDFFEVKLKSWKEKLHTVLHEQVGVPKEIVDDIAVVPAGQLKRLQLLPNGECWMSRLWLKALAACSSRAQPAFIRINEHRFKSIDDTNIHNMLGQLSVQQDFLRDRPLILASKGEAIGAALGYPEGLGYLAGLSSGEKSNESFKLLVLLALKNKIIDTVESLLDPDSCNKKPTTKSTSALRATYGLIQMCAFCGKHTGKFQTCGSCKKVMYCNRECQKKDWKNHKTICQTEHLQPKPCSGCEKNFLTLQSCPCHKAAYCSKECQRMDWYKHKPACTAIKRV